MKNTISMKRAVQATICILVFLAVLSVWPMKLIRPWQYMGSVDKESKAITANEGAVLQQFIPVNDCLRSLSFYVYNEDTADIDGKTLYFRLFDANLNKLEYSVFSLLEENIPGLFTIPMRGEWKAGEVYYFSIECPGAELLLSMEDGLNVDILYGYRVYFTAKQYLLIGGCILLAGVLLLLAAELVFRKKDAKKVSIGMLWRMPAGVLATAGALFAAYNVFPAKRLATETVDIIFYETGILLFLLFTWYCLFHKKEPVVERTLSLKECLSELSDRLPDILQTVSFAGVMLGCVRYLNALSTFDQKSAGNITVACFALAILCGFAKEELFNVYQLVYIVLAAGACIRYCVQRGADEESLILARGTAVAFALWGMVAVNVLYHLFLNIRKKRNIFKNISPVYSIMLLLLLAEFIRSRNGKQWPVTWACLWILFALRLLDRGGRERYLSNFVNGVFLHFVGICIYAWLHRPFHFYTHTRYPGVFHTVTSSAVYDCFVLVLALAVFLVKYARTKKISLCLKELWVFGLAGGFMLLTASRTGLYAAAALAVMLIVVTSFTEFKDGILKALLRTGLLLLTLAGFFVGTFTACRIIPAVYNKPQTFEIEWFQDSIKEGEDWNSFRYITVRKFLAVFDAKLTYYDKEHTAQEAAVSETQEGVTGFSSPELTEEKEGIGGNADYTNGRMDIYKKYLSLLDWKGHRDVAVQGDNGKMIAHAHNAYIQVAYDFGIGAGIYFLLFCVVFGIRSIYYYSRHKGGKAGIVPVAVIGVFGICGLVEWVMLPYIPTGFALFFVLVLLMPKIKDTKDL